MRKVVCTEDHLCYLDKKMAPSQTGGDLINFQNLIPLNRKDSEENLEKSQEIINQAGGAAKTRSQPSSSVTKRPPKQKASKQQKKIKTKCPAVKRKQQTKTLKKKPQKQKC